MPCLQKKNYSNRIDGESHENRHLQFDNLIKCITVREISGDMLNKVLPPRWRRESVKYGN